MADSPRVSFRVTRAVWSRLIHAAQLREIESPHLTAQQILSERVLNQELNTLTVELTEVKARLDDLSEQLASFRARFEEVVTRRTP